MTGDVLRVTSMAGESLLPMPFPRSLVQHKAPLSMQTVNFLMPPQARRAGQRDRAGSRQDARTKGSQGKMHGTGVEAKRLRETGRRFCCGACCTCHLLPVAALLCSTAGSSILDGA